MTLLAKLAAALVGLFSLAMGVMAWVDPVGLGEIVGVVGPSELGQHTIRGDFGALFLTCAIGCGIALFKGNPKGMLLPILLYGLVLAGRLASLVLVGNGPGVMTPILTEVILIALAFFAYRGLKSA